MKTTEQIAEEMARKVSCEIHDCITPSDCALTNEQVSIIQKHIPLTALLEMARAAATGRGHLFTCAHYDGKLCTCGRTFKEELRKLPPTLLKDLSEI